MFRLDLVNAVSCLLVPKVAEQAVAERGKLLPKANGLKLDEADLQKSTRY